MQTNCLLPSPRQAVRNMCLNVRERERGRVEREGREGGREGGKEGWGRKGVREERSERGKG